MADPTVLCQSGTMQPGRDKSTAWLHHEWVAMMTMVPKTYRWTIFAKPTYTAIQHALLLDSYED